jgi:hypothetical protein
MNELEDHCRSGDIYKLLAIHLIEQFDLHSEVGRTGMELFTTNTAQVSKNHDIAA